MSNIQYNTQVDINSFPDRDSAHVAKRGTKFTMGDLHGNALKLMYMLVRHGVIKISKTDYEAFVEIYYTAPEELTKAQLNKFNEILSSTKVNAESAINLVGDVVCDRGENDYFTLKILKKLHDSHVPFEINYSNHDADFVTAYESQEQFYPGMLMHFGVSMSNMQRLIEKGLISREEVLEMTDSAYKPHLKLIDYALSDNEISISTHAGVGLKNIRFVANKLGIAYDDTSANALAETIDRINQKFSNDYVMTNRMGELIEQAMLAHGFYGMNFDLEQQEKFPIEHMIWNRNYVGLDRPAEHNGYKINFIHGHDSSEPSHDNIINVDNMLGKSTYHHENIYNVLCQDNLPVIEVEPAIKATSDVSTLFNKIGDAHYKATYPEEHARLAQTYLDYCFEHGLQKGAIKALAQGAHFTVKMYQLLSNEAYRQNNPKMIKALRTYLRSKRKPVASSSLNPQDTLLQAVINGQDKQIQNALRKGAVFTKVMFAKVSDPIYKATFPEAHKILTQAYLDHCLQNGLQKGAIIALTRGAHFTTKMYQLLSNQAYHQNNPKTIAALKAYLQAKRQSSSSQQSVHAATSQPTLPVSVAQTSSAQNSLDIPLGDGLFRDLGLSHVKIAQLRREQASNVIIQNAFKVIEEADKGFQSDIRYLTDFIHSKRDSTRISETDVVKMIDEDVSILCSNRSLFGSGQNPKTWCVQRLLDDEILTKAKRMIQNHPELLDGRLPKPLKEYKSREVSVLKTALIYCSLARDEKNFLMRNVKGAYRLELNSAQKEAVKNMHIVRGMDTLYLYAPLNSYVLRATQIEKLNSGDKVMMGDCSGYVTNVLKELFGKEYPRLFTYDLACFHDFKMRRRQSLSTQNQGPIISGDGEHSALTRQEIDNSDHWRSNHAREFDYLDSRLQTVSDMKNIKAGDLIIWRNKSTVDGRGHRGINGHVGVVLAADPARNTVSLMENTAGSAYGLGIKNVPIVSEGTTTRILRPKI
ncbi:Dot/Icm T4SS effector Wip [Candidatus Berkiella aquae]|uniref:WipA-like phosphatase domain-containing protein n=1 Tax=Candidatus Berkiella aquae TaxID=295108 RepID=A0A0Q9YLZ8_9GAMM|nr:Dot/Icm T4SS effector Wip [Candidatus Berkiella aquae]MCS5710535.1 hypothetical protein [Candidatus Berkiella aquae]